MKVLRDPQILRGYLVEQPFDAWPAVTHCGEALCARGHHLSPHRHPVFEFLLVTAGRITWLVDRHEFVQTAGDLFIAFPEQIHRTGSRPDSENQYLWIGIDLAALGPSGRRLARRLLRGNNQLVPKCAELEPLFLGVVAQAISSRPRAEVVARRYLDLVIALVAQQLQPNEEATKPQAVPRSLPVQRCLAYMQSNLDRRLPLEEIARVGAIRNIAHFCTRFRREVGMAPGVMHRQLRLEAARAALRKADATITVVAHQFGFSSSQHFSSAFRVAFGVSPSRWLESAVTTIRA